MDVKTVYFARLTERGYQADDAQARAIDRLERMSDEFSVFKARRSNRLKKLINRPTVPRGVWLWGGVGRGKSFLMDCFYEAVAVRRKARFHFHEFMRGVHRELEELKGTSDPLEEVARRVAVRYRLICFDEFHVSDIADAMILERLMRALLANGVTFVITSNYAPSRLYPDGLHRDRILPAIELLERSLDIINVDTGVDYRRRAMERINTYLWPLDESAHRGLEEAFEAIARAPVETGPIEVAQRSIDCVRHAPGVAWFTFEALCAGPRSQLDYLELARRFDVLIVSDVPRMSAAMGSEARRFVWLIDVLYDQRVKLIVSAQCESEHLYVAGPMAGEFHRTVSRIVEMQGREYRESPRRTVVERIA